MIKQSVMDWTHSCFLRLSLKQLFFLVQAATFHFTVMSNGHIFFTFYLSMSRSILPCWNTFIKIWMKTIFIGECISVWSISSILEKLLYCRILVSHQLYWHILVIFSGKRYVFGQLEELVLL